MFECITCKYQSEKLCNLKRHILNKHSREPQDKELQNKILNELSELNIYIDKQKINTNEFICLKCLKNFKSLKGYKKHEYLCKEVSNILECHYCHKTFSSQQTKSKHMNYCKIKISHEQIKQTKNDLIEATLISNTSNITNNNTNHNQIIYNITNYRISGNEYRNKFVNNINEEDVNKINDFGQENISYISDEQMYRFASNHLLNDFIIDKHFNIQHPENHNIRKNCKKSYKVLKNKEWFPLHKDSVYSIIYNNTKAQLYDTACKKIFPNLSEEEMQDYMSMIDRYDKFFKKNIYKMIDIQQDELMKKKDRCQIVIN